MDNNIGENITSSEMTQPEQTTTAVETKKPGKKKFIIIGAIAAVAIVVVLVLLLGGPGKGKIKIEGKTYSYSAEKGIKGIEKISGGVVIMNGASASLYTDGKTEKIDPFEVYEGKYPVVYLGSRATGEEDLAISSFDIYGEYKTHDGATWDCTVSDLEKKGYLYAGNMCYMIVPEKGSIDWDDIEKDYDKIISSDTFDGIDYMDGVLATCPDAVEPSVYRDDVQGVVDLFNDMMRDGDGKASMMLWLARGKAAHMLLEGEIDYFAIEGVMCSEDEGGPLNIQIFTSKADAEKIKENFGLK